MLDKDEIFDSTVLKFIDDFEYVLKDFIETKNKIL